MQKIDKKKKKEKCSHTRTLKQIDRHNKWQSLHVMQSLGLNLFRPRNVIKSIFHLLRCYLTLPDHSFRHLVMYLLFCALSETQKYAIENKTHQHSTIWWSVQGKQHHVYWVQISIRCSDILTHPTRYEILKMRWTILAISIFNSSICTVI